MHVLFPLRHARSVSFKTGYVLDVSKYWHFYIGKKPSSLKCTKQLLTEIQANFRILPCSHKPKALAIKGVFEAVSSSSSDLFCFFVFDNTHCL